MKNFQLVILLFFGSIVFGQNEKIVWDKSFAVKDCQDFGADRFGNMYVLHGEEIIKLDPNGKTLYRFSDPASGSITYVDPFLSMDLLIYYRDFFSVVVLDNRLNPIISPIRLDEFGYYDVQWVKATDQNSLWFYDQATDRLIKWSVPDQTPALESLNLSQTVGREITPTYLLQTINHVFVNNQGKEILQFDLFGNFIKSLPIKTPDEFQVMNYKVYYLAGGELVIYDPALRQEKRLPVPDKGPWRKYQVSEEYLYQLGKTELHRFKITR